MKLGASLQQAAMLWSETGLCRQLLGCPAGLAPRGSGQRTPLASCPRKNTVLLFFRPSTPKGSAGSSKRQYVILSSSPPMQREVSCAQNSSEEKSNRPLVGKPTLNRREEGKIGLGRTFLSKKFQISFLIVINFMQSMISPDS